MAKEVVSGVGSQSKRTDQNPSKQAMRYYAGGKYGEGKALLEQQQGAPMAGKVKQATPQQTKPSIFSQLTPITAPTERPNEAPEVGMPFGEGPGPTEVGLNIASGRPDNPRKQDLQRLTQYLPMIENAANQEGAPITLNNFVKYLRSL
jgi:hypothetical protein